ncbi:MAG TPA: RNA polymerase factor sigma-54 [Candidatus Sulfotelmatobacter sp.]|nr:RNA polymerase factor sigma-54 [Candidatus Sulfotelmatobacter sp.]
MALSQRLDLRQTQALVMTPQLQQAIKLLQLSNLELSLYVEAELEQNPLLEREEPEREGPEPEPSVDAAPADAATARDSADYVGAETMPSADDHPLDVGTAGAEPADDGTDLGYAEANFHAARTGGRADFDDPDFGLEQTLSREVSLREHLAGQLSVDIADPVDRMIGLHLIDLVDDAGYLTGPTSQVAELLNCPVERVEATLALLQRFDPPGVFARNLAECLTLQLKDRNRWDPCMEALVANLHLLAARDYEGLRRLCSVDADDLHEMIAEIRALNPKPGETFDRELPQAVTPDILMRAQPGGGWLIELNSETLPRVLVNTRYYSRIARGSLKREEKEYISERLQSANWLVKSLHQRANTILRVATEIVRQQEGFFLHGVQYLRPLILRDIAEAIGMHESTVSRVTTNKYMATPRGMYELKYFFTSAIASSAGGMAHSAEAVRFRIKGLIDNEASDDVLSDDKIVETLLKEGVDIARRTVAKYREAMRIPSSVQRRREKALRR